MYARPTVFFDGGYRVDLGAGPNWDPYYIASINACGERVVPNIDLNLSLIWLGNAKMNIGVTIQNNDTADYQGRLRVYVAETVSSLGWKDYNGKLYVLPFLDYAFNESVFVAAGTTWQDSTIWNGYYHSDGHGNYFRNITRGNITILGAVFNAEWHQGYSDPPNNLYPFNAYYVDDAAGIWIDVPPNVPGDSIPFDLSTLVNPFIDLRWTCVDSNYFDTLTYDVYLGKTTPPLFAATRSSRIYDPGQMDFGTTYYWQIVAKDGHGDSTASPVWSFTTIARGDCNRDGNVNVSDVLYLINYKFKGGSTPNPLEVADVNCSGLITIDDVIYLINYLFRGGPPPCS
jgi:hypothetical protein